MAKLFCRRWRSVISPCEAHIAILAMCVYCERLQYSYYYYYYWTDHTAKSTVNIEKAPTIAKHNPRSKYFMLQITAKENYMCICRVEARASLFSALHWLMCVFFFLQ